MNERVKVIRKYLKLSQRDFSKRLGVTAAGISKIESGNRGLTPQMLLLICQQYRVNRHWLETGEGEMFDSDPKEEGKLSEALRLFKSLRPEFQDYALQQIEKLLELQKKV